MKIFACLPMTFAIWSSINSVGFTEDFFGGYVGGSISSIHSSFDDGNIEFAQSDLNYGLRAGIQLLFEDMIVGLEIARQNTNGLSQTEAPAVYTIEHNIDLNFRVGFPIGATLFYASGGFSEAILDIAIPGQGGTGVIRGTNLGLGFEKEMADGYFWGIDLRRREYTENKTITDFVVNPVMADLSFLFGKRF